MPGSVTVLRLGHRPQRDKRLTTHVCLTARAFGADRIVFPSMDSAVERTVRDVVDRFGGGMRLEEDASWRALLKGFEGTSVHLTMYGEPHTVVAERIQPDEDLCIVLGAEKVPREVYDLVDHNVAVGNQPHSEVAALAILLYEILGPDPLTAEREGAQIQVLPSARGKRVASLDEDA